MTWRSLYEPSQWVLVAVLAVLTFEGDPFTTLPFFMVFAAASIGILVGARARKRGAVALGALANAVVAILCLLVLFVDPWTEGQLFVPGGWGAWTAALLLAVFGFCGAWFPPVPRVWGPGPSAGHLVVIACQGNDRRSPTW